MTMHLRCPTCHGSQFRSSPFDVSENNPHGAKCIFCKSNMVENVNFCAPTVRPTIKLAEYCR
ncbi:cold shock small protein YmcF [Phytobacter sp. V91]|uniref:cold shock small protein YmcF n=1 Tax=Phytobacter sp. V91 TaxID=3369425 RepID=UPI003F645056